MKRTKEKGTRKLNTVFLMPFCFGPFFWENEAFSPFHPKVIRNRSVWEALPFYRRLCPVLKGTARRYTSVCSR